MGRSQFPLSNAKGKHHWGCSNKTPQKHLLVFRTKYAIYHSCNKSDVTLRSSAPSLGFVQGHKSIVQLLLTINCALKFYSLFMMCNVMWFMWTQWVTGSNCGSFLRTVPSRRPPKNCSCQSTFSGPVPLRSKHFTAGHHGPDGKNVSQPLSLRTDEGKSKPCFLTHGGDSVLIATLFPHMKHSDCKSGDGQSLWLWSMLQWLDATFMLMTSFYSSTNRGVSVNNKEK